MAPFIVNAQPLLEEHRVVGIGAVDPRALPAGAAFYSVDFGDVAAGGVAPATFVFGLARVAAPAQVGPAYDLAHRGVQLPIDANPGGAFDTLNLDNTAGGAAVDCWVRYYGEQDLALLVATVASPRLAVLNGGGPFGPIAPAGSINVALGIASHVLVVLQEAVGEQVQLEWYEGAVPALAYSLLFSNVVTPFSEQALYGKPMLAGALTTQFTIRNPGANPISGDVYLLEQY